MSASFTFTLRSYQLTLIDVMLALLGASVLNLMLMGTCYLRGTATQQAREWTSSEK